MHDVLCPLLHYSPEYCHHEGCILIKNKLRGGAYSPGVTAFALYACSQPWFDPGTIEGPLNTARHNHRTQSEVALEHHFAPSPNYQNKEMNRINFWDQRNELVSTLYPLEASVWSETPHGPWEPLGATHSTEPGVIVTSTGCDLRNRK